MESLCFWFVDTRSKSPNFNSKFDDWLVYLPWAIPEWRCKVFGELKSVPQNSSIVSLLFNTNDPSFMHLCGSSIVGLDCKCCKFLLTVRSFCFYICSGLAPALWDDNHFKKRKEKSKCSGTEQNAQWWRKAHFGPRFCWGCTKSWARKNVFQTVTLAQYSLPYLLLLIFCLAFVLSDLASSLPSRFTLEVNLFP